MSVKAGVWIDHRQAIVVRVTEAGNEIKKIASGIKKSARSGSQNTYTPNDFVAEDRLERAFDSHLKHFYDEVIACLQGSEAILILGPGEAKGELRKRCQSKKLRGLFAEAETADKMTDRQLVSKVAQHFATNPATNSASPKKMARTAAKNASKKPTRTSGK
jgi:hypothetical protein